MALIRKEIGDLLVDNGVITQDELDLVRQEHQKSGESVIAVLSRLGLAGENHLKNALELQYGVNYVSLQKREPDPEILALIPEDVVRQHLAVPVTQQGNRLTVAMVDPSDSSALEALKSHLNGLVIKTVVCLEDDFNSFVDIAFAKEEPEPEPEPEAVKAQSEPPQSDRSESAVADKPQEPDQKSAEKIVERKVTAVAADTVPVELPHDEPASVNHNMVKSTGEHSAVKEIDKFSEQELTAKAKEEAIVLLANKILEAAIKQHCSNIHIQATDKQVFVHYRLNGTLYVDRKLPRPLLTPLVTRFKMMARLNIGERRLPQDGHIKVKSSGKEIVCLVSVIPTEHGESLSMWIV